MAWADFGAKEKEYLADVLDSGWISRHKYIPKFEKEIARVHGQKFGLMVNSGTDALRIGLATLKEAHGWKDGSEVLVPAVTFVATVNAVLQNALRPVLVDVDRLTYSMTSPQVRDACSPKATAIIPVHLFGLPASMPALVAVAGERNLKVLEDSCETMFVHKVRGDMAAFSTYMAHMVQTGVGGVLTTSSPVYDALARSYANHGRSSNPDRFEFERIGYSSRSTEMEAALGCAQLLRRQDILNKRQAVARRLWFGLHGLPLQMTNAFESSSWMLFPMVLLSKDRDALMNHLFKRGIESRQMMPLTDQPCYKHLFKEDDYPVAKWINRNGICLPCHQLLANEEVDYMIESVTSFFK